MGLLFPIYVYVLRRWITESTLERFKDAMSCFVFKILVPLCFYNFDNCFWVAWPRVGVYVTGDYSIFIWEHSGYCILASISFKNPRNLHIFRGFCVKFFHISHYSFPYSFSRILPIFLSQLTLLFNFAMYFNKLKIPQIILYINYQRPSSLLSWPTLDPYVFILWTSISGCLQDLCPACHL